MGYQKRAARQQLRLWNRWLGWRIAWRSRERSDRCCTSLGQVVGDRISHGGASGVRQAVLETKIQQVQRTLTKLQAQREATAASATATEATPRVEERSVTPLASPAMTESLFLRGTFVGSTSRPPKFDRKRDTWSILENDVFGFVGYKGCKDALVVATSNPVMVADHLPFLTRIGCQGTRLLLSNVLR